MAKNKFNLDDAIGSSLEGAKVDTKQKILTIEKKVDKFKTADKLMDTPNEKTKETPIVVKPKLETKVINLTEKDSNRLEKLLDRCMLQKLRINKSEILRMGLIALEENNDDKLKAFFNTIEQLKTGRIK